jgi:NMD protein affecting ribosome stability and mRNA decay
MKEEIRVEIEMEQKMCSFCKKSSSEYYEMLVHLRLKYFRDVDVVKKKMLSKFLNDEKIKKYINKIDEVPNGYNIYFSSYGIMNKISDLFIKNYLCDEKRSKKLVGRDNLKSKDKYRHFLSLSLVNIKKGDIIRIKGIEYELKALNNNKIMILINSENGSKNQESYGIIKDYLQLKGFDY